MSRKSILNALLAQLAPAGGPLIAGGRRLQNQDNAAAVGAPVLFLIKPNETYDRASSGLPPLRVLETYAAIYFNVGIDQTAVPADVVDDLLDAVDAALAPNVFDQARNQGRQTLNGTVHNCQIVGSIDITPNDKLGRGVVVIPIHVTLLPNRALS